MNAPHRFTTSSIEARERLKQWNDAAVETFGPLVVDAEDRAAFVGELVYLPLQSVALCSIESGASVARHSDASGPHPSPEDTLNIVVQDKGLSCISISGRDEELMPGDLLVLDPARSASIAMKQPARLIVLMCPRSRLGERSSRLESALGTKFSGRGAPALLSGLARSASRELASDWSAHIAEAAELAMWPLFDAAFGEPLPAHSRPEYWFSIAEKTVRDGLTDPNLGAKDIARLLGLSERYVHSIFASRGTTPSRYILSERLQLAAARLGGSEVRARVTDIASA